MTVSSLIWKLVKILFTRGNLYVTCWDYCDPELVETVIIVADEHISEYPCVLLGTCSLKLEDGVQEMEVK